MQNPLCISILVAEDNVINQTLFIKMLSLLGHDARMAEDGEQALKACLSQPFDLVFMDYQMPGIDGIEAAKNIKRIDQHPKPIIILMTANLLVNSDYLVLPGVIDDFLKKPFTLQEIEAVIEKWQPQFAVH